MADTQIKYTKLPVRKPSHLRFRQFATRWRMSVTEAVDFAIETLEGLPREEIASRIERRPPRRRQPATA